ncbi:MAG: ABC transporter permease [Caldilineaceae bacterium]|nr:ABC transporter permease [Caldilineaceae bacterium]
MTTSAIAPTAHKRIQTDDGFLLPDPGRLEKALGPEWARIIRGLITNPLSVTGLLVVILFLLIAAAAPVLAPPLNAMTDPYQIPRDGFGPTPQEPGSAWDRDVPPLPFWYESVTGKTEWVHLLGTTSGQFDIYYGIVWGTRTALLVGVLVVFAGLFIGLIVGSISGYYGGVTDDILMRITEIFMAFPFLLAALTLSAILVPLFGRGIWPSVIALISFGWMGYARVIRGDILATKERDYVLSARTVGARDGTILLRHILPNAIFTTMVLASLDVGAIVLTFAALSFLGVGTDIGYADWGQVISFARSYILSLDTYWYIIVYPGIALILFGLGWNLIGDGLRDVLDPRMKK